MISIWKYQAPFINMAFPLNRITIIQSIFVFLLLLTSCGTSATADYDRLCDIYTAIVKQSVEYGQKEYLLAEEIENQLPDFFNKNYVHIVESARVKRYAFIKQLAEVQTNKSWECGIIKEYYSGKYDSLEQEQ